MEMVMKFPNGETPNLFIEVFNYTAALRFTDMLHLWIWRTETRTRGAARRLLLESRVLLFETLLTETLPKSDLGWTRLSQKQGCPFLPAEQDEAIIHSQRVQSNVGAKYSFTFVQSYCSVEGRAGGLLGN